MKTYYELTCSGNCTLDNKELYDLKNGNNIFIFDLDGEDITIAAALDEDEDLAEAMTDFMNKAELECGGFEFEAISEEEFEEHKRGNIYIFREREERGDDAYTFCADNCCDMADKPVSQSDKCEDAEDNYYETSKEEEEEFFGKCVDDDDEETYPGSRMTGEFTPTLIFLHEAYENAAKSDLSEALMAEIDRIYSANRAAVGKGYPVHYYMEIGGHNFDDVKTLLDVLETKGRLIKRSTVWITAENFYMLNREINMQLIENLYTISGYGVVVFDISGEEDDMLIKHLCRYAELYASKVLTIFCGQKYTENSPKLLRMIFDHTDAIEILPIMANELTGKNAEKYLRKAAEELSLDVDDELLGYANDFVSYTKEELMLKFTKWSGSKLRTKIFPEYQFLEDERIKAQEELKQLEWEMYHEDEVKTIYDTGDIEVDEWLEENDDGTFLI